MAKRTQEAQSSQAVETAIKGPCGLHELIRQSARQIIHQAIEAELAALLEQYSNVKTLDGRRAIVRNGYLPEREIVTAIGPVPVQAPKVRDRSGSGAKFNSNMVPPYVCKSPRASAAPPWLYLRGVSTGDMSEAFSVLLGKQAKGLSPNVVARLKAQWVQESEQWNKRDLSASRWVYWWADGIHTGARSFDQLVATYSANYLKAIEKLTKDRDELLAFYDFPVEHWQRVRTTNPIESTFAMVRHRTTRTRNCLSRATFLGMAFKLIESAEKSWRRIRGFDALRTASEGHSLQGRNPGDR